jgi:micrococcal nuclease
MSTIPRDGTRNILATEEMSYEECENFMPLLDGDVVFCPSVYDGDTARVCFVDRVGNRVRILVRIPGIDTPEVRSSSEKEKSLALRAKKRLEEAVAGKFVTIRNPGVEKYSRSLSDLQTDTIESVTDYMLEDPEICRPYDGGKKVSWD